MLQELKDLVESRRFIIKKFVGGEWCQELKS
jgi:hypothetical protein